MSSAVGEAPSYPPPGLPPRATGPTPEPRISLDALGKQEDDEALGQQDCATTATAKRMPQACQALPTPKRRRSSPRPVAGRGELVASVLRLDPEDEAELEDAVRVPEGGLSDVDPAVVDSKTHDVRP